MLKRREGKRLQSHEWGPHSRQCMLQQLRPRRVQLLHMTKYRFLLSCDRLRENWPDLCQAAIRGGSDSQAKSEHWIPEGSMPPSIGRPTEQRTKTARFAGSPAK